MINILVVCTANVCRSPVGEAILRDRLRQKELPGWAVSSAGTWALEGTPAAAHSVLLMAEQGIDISTHRACLIDETLLADTDLVLCLESGHVETINAKFPACAGKVYLLSEMVDRRYSVADPYGESLLIYRRMVAEVTELVEEGLDRIVELARAHAGRRECYIEGDRRATNLQ